MSNDTKYVFTSGDYSVLWHKKGFDVVQSRNGAAHSTCTFAMDADGLGLAIARARYLQRVRDAIERKERTGKATPTPKNAREIRKAEAAFCTQEGKRLFALGVRKAHAEWLDA